LVISASRSSRSPSASDVGGIGYLRKKCPKAQTQAGRSRKLNIPSRHWICYMEYETNLLADEQGGGMQGSFTQFIICKSPKHCLLHKKL